MSDTPNRRPSGLDPHSAVPFYPDHVRMDNGSDDTLTDIGEETTTQQKHDAFSTQPNYAAQAKMPIKGALKRPSMAHGGGSYSRPVQRPVIQRRWSSVDRPPVIHSQHCYDPESHHKKSQGFFGRIIAAIKRFTQDQDIVRETKPQAYLKRRSSWAGNMQHPRREPNNNFERSLAINANDEETYLYGDEPERQGNVVTALQDLSGARYMSYAERRKQERHTIKHYLESQSKMVLSGLFQFGS